MANKWTDDQQRVISSRNSNLLVAAAAGSGKTAVLIERIISMITDEKNPVDIDKILGVTFTRAAATEMKERISDALSKKLNENPDDMRLKKQSVLLNKAKISTIHSFCMDLIKNNFHLVDLDAGFRTASDEEIVILQKQAINTVFEKMYEDGFYENELEELIENDAEFAKLIPEINKPVKDDFLDLIEMISDKLDDESGASSIIGLYNNLQSQVSPFGFVTEKLGYFADMNSRKVTEISVYKDFSEDILNKVCSLETMIDEIENDADILSANSTDMTLCYELINSYRNLIKDRDSFFEGISDFVFIDLRRFPRGSKKDPEKKERIDNLKEKIKYFKEKYTQATSGYENLNEEFISQSISSNIKYMKTVYIVLRLFDAEYSRLKKQRAIIDYSDMEHMTLDILTDRDSQNRIVPSEVALEISKNYKEVFVDEYQDINPIQEAILESVSSKNPYNRFMVGDIKQSIYGFRNAEPGIFIEKYREYKNDDTSDKRKVVLSKNFRSRKNVLESTNFLFSRIMSRESGQIEYDDNEALYCGAVFEEDTQRENDYSTEIFFIDIDKEEKEKSEKENRDSKDEKNTVNEEIDAEVHKTYEIIKELTDEKDGFRVWDKDLNAYRTAKYSDIVILSRDVKNISEKYSRYLESKSIPVFTDSTSGFFQTIEVKMILSFLKVIDNPDQDIEILGVMRSPVFNFTADELAKIRIKTPGVTYYNALLGYEESDDQKLYFKIKNMLEEISMWREKSKYISLDELIWFLLYKTGIYAFFGGLPNGKQRQKNLRMVFEKAKSFENSSIKGLYNFIIYIEKLKLYGSDTGEAKLLSEGSDVVRFMSIHKSKGLEFPIVIIVNAGKNFKDMDSRNDLVIDEEYGIISKYFDPYHRIKMNTIFNEMAKKKRKRSNIAEEMRILYVAMTRAKEKLFIIGKMNKFEENYKKLSSLSDSEKINPDDVINAQSYIQWFAMALSNHRAMMSLNEGLDIDGKKYFATESEWKVEVVNKIDFEDSSEAGGNNDGRLSPEETGVIEGMRERVEQELDWKYRFSDITDLPSSISVSEIKKIYEDRANLAESEIETLMFKENADEKSEHEEKTHKKAEQKNDEKSYEKAEEEKDAEEKDAEKVEFSKTLKTLKKPKFMEKEKEYRLTSAERGSLVHMVMQVIDYSRTDTVEDIEKQLESFYDKGILNDNTAKIINAEKIYSFFKSEIGQRAKKSDYLAKEREVYTALEINQIYGDIKAGIKDTTENQDSNKDNEDRNNINKCVAEKKDFNSQSDNPDEDYIMMRGIVDMFFEEDGELVVVDFKTDSMYGVKFNDIREKYRMQIELYSEALEVITGKKVKEKYLYLFAVDSEVRV